MTLQDHFFLIPTFFNVHSSIHCSVIVQYYQLSNASLRLLLSRLGSVVECQKVRSSSRQRSTSFTLCNLSSARQGNQSLLELSRGNLSLLGSWPDCLSSRSGEDRLSEFREEGECFAVISDLGFDFSDITSEDGESLGSLDRKEVGE